MKRLTLDETNKKWLGLCAGIANYVEVDVTIVRLIVVVVTIMTGIFPGLITYLIAAAITPKN
ncbi:PspC domain-containing protein [Candidatus Saccharibacteria bacterium]|nr:PspC domain-containing protein [Candidatus Saccharibacteria bacterium]